MSSVAGPRGREPAAPATVTVPDEHVIRWRVKRAGLICLMGLASINAWTGSPLAALWIGSRVQPSGPPQMGPIALVAVLIGVFSFGTLRILNWLGVVYDKLLGLTSRRRQHSPWLRSVRGEREDIKDPERARLSALEIVVIISVILAVLSFETWFFFFSTSPIDGRSGR